MDIQVSSGSVIQVIQQFLKENHLLRTLNVLQEESGIALDAVDSIDDICHDIRKGKWDFVVSSLSCVSLPYDMLEDVYEQIFLEFIEKGEKEMCKRLLMEALPLQNMKVRDPLSGVRFKKLESLLAGVEGADLYRGTSRSERRNIISDKLKSMLRETQSGRLLQLLNYALVHERSVGKLPGGLCNVDLLTGSVTQIEHVVQKLSSVLHRINFPKGCVPNCCLFSRDYLITGSSDGLVEIWNSISGKLELSLDYQAGGNFIVHASPISCIALDIEGNQIVCGDVMGDIRVWNIANGRCVKEFVSAHSDSVTAVCFSAPDSSQIISGSIGGALKAFGIKSGRVLREYPTASTGHVTDITTLHNWDIVAALSDGSVSVFCGHGASLICSFQPGLTEDGPSQCSPVVSVKVVKLDTEELLLVCTKGDKVYLTSIGGAIRKEFSVASDQLTACAVSSMNNMFYCSSSTGNVYTFALDHAEPKHVMNLAHMELTSLCQKQTSSDVAVCGSTHGVYILGAN